MGETRLITIPASIRVTQRTNATFLSPGGQNLRQHVRISGNTS